MKGRILIFIVCFFAYNIHAQVNPAGGSKPTTPTPAADELLTHLTAAENFQRSGELSSAAYENRKILAIALQRAGRIAIEEGRYTDAVKHLTESLKYADSADNRTNLAIAYLRQDLFDEAARQAQIGIALDPDHIGSRYILGNIYYSKEDYEAALPELRWVFAAAPDFEIARALGLTYLNLKLIDEAKQHFAKMQESAGSEGADLHVLVAKFYERTNYPAEAEEELRKALILDPVKPRVSFYLGYLLLQNGGSERLKEAGRAFEQELKITPNDFFSNFFAGVVASSENDHQRAIPFLQNAVTINPSSSEAYLFLAQSQLEVDDLVNAEKNLRLAIKFENSGTKNTQARRTHFILGRLLLKTGRKDEAKKELEIAGQLQQKSLDSSRNEIDRILGQVADDSDLGVADDKPSSQKIEINLTPEQKDVFDKLNEFLGNVIAQAFNSLGVIATVNNRLTEARDYFSSAFEWNPDLPNVSRNLGIVGFRASQFEKSIKPLAYHLASNPNDILIRKMLGSSYYLTKDYANSVATLKPIEQSLNEDAELAYFYGISLIQLKRNKEAIPVFNRLAAASQQEPASLFYAAQGFMIAGDYLRSVKEFKRVVQLAPDTSKANYFIGQSLIRLNRLEEAEQAFIRETELNPTDALSKYHVALTLIERKVETDRAIKVLEEALSLRANYADAHYQLGKIYLEKGDNQKAVAQLESAVSADAGKDYIHYQLSIAYRKVSRKADADRELKLYQKLKNEMRQTDTLLPMGVTEDSP